MLQNQQVDSLFAWLDDSLARDQNIRAIYLTRGPAGQWEASAWADATVEEAVAYVQMIIPDTSLFVVGDISEEPVEPCEFVLGPQTPVPLANGLFLDDPYQPVVAASTEKEALLRRLALAGHPVAPSISEMMVADPVNTSAGIVAKLTAFGDEIAAKIEVAVYGETDLTLAGLWPCSCTTTYGTPTCGPWVFVCSVPATGGGTTCHYKRSCTKPYTSTGQHGYCLSCATPPGGGTTAP